MAAPTTPGQYSWYFENPVWETEPCDGVTASLRDVAKHVATLEECEEGIYTQAENNHTVDIAPGDESNTVEDKEQTADVEANNMAGSETDTLVDREEDAWSVVSDGEQNQRLYYDDSDGDDVEADDEREIDGIDNDADVDEEEHSCDPRENEKLYGCTDDEERVDSTLTNADEEEHLDDCTEESIELREVKEQFRAFGQEAWEYECDLEKRHREELDYELETCRKEALQSKAQLEKRHREELEDLNREHGKELNYLNTALQEKMQHVDMCREEIYRRRAFEVAKSQQLEAIKRQHKTECDKERKRADEAEQQLKNKLQDMQDKHHQELEELKRRQHQTSEQLVKAAEAKTNKVNNENLKLRKELAEAVDDIQELVQKVRTDKAGHDQEIVRVKEEVSRQHEQAVGYLIDEHTELADFLWEAENEIDELRQKEQDMEAKHKQEMSKARANFSWLESKFRGLLVEVAEDKKKSDELRNQLQEAKCEVQELKEREQGLIAQQGADRAMFERSLRAMRKALQDSE